MGLGVRRAWLIKVRDLGGQARSATGPHGPSSVIAIAEPDLSKKLQRQAQHGAA